MAQLSREEYIELGVSFASDDLMRWAGRQLESAKGQEGRLRSRGVSPSSLGEIRELLETVGKGARQAPDPIPGAAAVALLVRDEALIFLREARLIAKVEFGSRPDLLARFRTGVQSGLLLANLTRELELVVVELREHTAQLAGIGDIASLIARGERLIPRVKEAKGNLDMACGALPSPAAQQSHDKGMLYDRTRRLVRIGQLEFMSDSTQSTLFNFSGIKRKIGSSTPPPDKKLKVSG